MTRLAELAEAAIEGELADGGLATEPAQVGGELLAARVEPLLLDCRRPMS